MLATELRVFVVAVSSVYKGQLKLILGKWKSRSLDTVKPVYSGHLRLGPTKSVRIIKVFWVILYDKV